MIYSALPHKGERQTCCHLAITCGGGIHNLGLVKNLPSSYYGNWRDQYAFNDFRWVWRSISSKLFGYKSVAGAQAEIVLTGC